MRVDAASRARLARVLRAVRLPVAAAAAVPVLLPSDSNDAWRIGPAFLRVCWRGDRGRFAREAAVTRALPAGVPYPEVLDTGFDGDLAWQVTRVVEGVPLATLWRGLSRAERRDAVHQIGQALAALHAHRFPADVVAALAAPRPVGDTSASALVGADVTALPLWRAESLLAAARHEGRADRALIDDVAARFRELADADPLGDAPLAEGGPLAAAALAEGGPPVGAVTCVHGDAHLGNALWKDGRLTALLDFEWVRLGPPDLEVEPYLRADAAGLTDTELLREALGWLAESYPAMFAVPDLVRRLWLYQLATAVRELFLAGPGLPPDDDAQRALRRIVESPDHLLRILPARHQHVRTLEMGVVDGFMPAANVGRLGRGVSAFGERFRPCGGPTGGAVAGAPTGPGWAALKAWILIFGPGGSAAN